jgi:hypothetical protein
MYRPDSRRCRRSRDTPAQLVVDAATDEDFLSPEPEVDDVDELDELELPESPDELDEDLADSELAEDDPSDEDEPFDPLAPSLPAETVLDPFRLSVR